MTTPFKHPCLPLLGALLWWVTGSASANDFPTVERVLFVQECMRAHPGPQFEMTSKCSCALDTLAVETKYDDYVTISTVAKAMSIGGERGGAIRDVASLEPVAKRYRELVAKAEQGCFLKPPGR